MNFLKKTYLKQNLLEPIDYIRWRINLIAEITKNEVFFEENDMEIIRFSKYYNLKTLKTNLNKENSQKIAKQMDLAYHKNISHGDINKKNILADQNNVILMDWEPCLKQVKFNQNVLMVTQPWIDPIDKINEEVSLNTDLLCFYRLIKPKKADFFHTDEWGNLRVNAIYSKIPFTYLTNTLLKGACHE